DGHDRVRRERDAVAPLASQLQDLWPGDELSERHAGPTGDRAHVHARLPSDVVFPFLGLVPTTELRCLRLALVPGLLEHGRNVRVRDEPLPALLIPLEQCPNPVTLVGVAEDDRAL